MTKLPNFNIQATTPLSQSALQTSCQTFHQAVSKVHRIPYGRNSNKENLGLVFTENKGTCSTKHAALAQLAIDHDLLEIELILGIYKMRESNTPGVGKVLDQYGLDYIPEAHNYLRWNGQRYDYTKMVHTADSPFYNLLEEITITPNQITHFKVEKHKAFLQKWIKEKSLSFSLDEIWKIREACIFAL